MSCNANHLINPAQSLSARDAALSSRFSQHLRRMPRSSEAGPWTHAPYRPRSAADGHDQRESDRDARKKCTKRTHFSLLALSKMRFRRKNKPKRTTKRTHFSLLALSKMRFRRKNKPKRTHRMPLQTPASRAQTQTNPKQTHRTPLRPAPAAPKPKRTHQRLGLAHRAGCTVQRSWAVGSRHRTLPTDLPPTCCVLHGGSQRHAWAMPFLSPLTSITYTADRRQALFWPMFCTLPGEGTEDASITPHGPSGGWHR